MSDGFGLAPMGSSGSREVSLELMEATETLCDDPQCLIPVLSHQPVRSGPGRLRRRMTTPESPTLSGYFFDDLRFESRYSGEQVVDSSELL